MARRDGEAIASEFIKGDESLRELAKRREIPWSTVRDRAQREDWVGRRLDARMEGDAAALETEAERLLRVTDKLIRRAEELIDGRELGARELNELMRALKSAKEIKMLRSALDLREQQARVRALEEKTEGAKRGSLRIEFSAEAEEAAQ